MIALVLTFFFVSQILILPGAKAIDCPTSHSISYHEQGPGTNEGVVNQCADAYGNGQSITAIPWPCAHFVNWSDGRTEPTRFETNVTDNVDLTSFFDNDSHSITYEINGGGDISGDNTQILLGRSSGTEVSAVAKTGFEFSGWSDGFSNFKRTDSSAISDKDCANKTFTANFAPIPQVSYTYQTDGNGEISGEKLQNIYIGYFGSEVRAVPNPGFQFVKWDDENTSNPRTDLAGPDPQTFTAIFEPNPTYTYQTDGNGLISFYNYSDGTSSVQNIQTIDSTQSNYALSAIPNSGYIFSYWEDTLSTDPSRYDFGTARSLTAIAHFSKLEAVYHADDLSEGSPPSAIDWQFDGYSPYFLLSGPNTLVRTNYDLVGWCTQPVDSISGNCPSERYYIGNQYSFYPGGITRVDFYPIWIHVEYHHDGSDGGTAPMNTTNFDNPYVANRGTLYKAGYYFGGWCGKPTDEHFSCPSDATSYSENDWIDLSNSQDLYPIWIPYSNNHSLKNTLNVRDPIDAYLDIPFVQGSYVQTLHKDDGTTYTETFDNQTPGDCFNVFEDKVASTNAKCPYVENGPIVGIGGGTAPFTATNNSSIPTSGGSWGIGAAVNEPDHSPNSDDGKYLQINFKQAQKYFGIWWAAGNDGNTIEFFKSNALTNTLDQVAKMDTHDVVQELSTLPVNLFPRGNWPECNLSEPTYQETYSLFGNSFNRPDYFGNPQDPPNESENSCEPYAYIHFLAKNGFSFDTVRLYGRGFEFDNLTISTAQIEPLERLIPIKSYHPENWDTPNLTFQAIFDTNGGSDIENIQIFNGRPFKLPDQPSKPNYTFIGWWDGTKLFNAADDYSNNFPGDITFKAFWAPTTNSIANGSFEFVPNSTMFEGYDGGPTQIGRVINGAPNWFWKTSALDEKIEVQRLTTNASDPTTSSTASVENHFLGAVNTINRQLANPYFNYSTSTPSDGNYFAEINNDYPSLLYQDVVTTPETTLRWTLHHKGRQTETNNGDLETMHVEIGNSMDPNSAKMNYFSQSFKDGRDKVGNVPFNGPTDPLALRVEGFESGQSEKGNVAWTGYDDSNLIQNSTVTLLGVDSFDEPTIIDTNLPRTYPYNQKMWGVYSGTYKVPAGQTLTRFGFVSDTPGSLGNLLDNITFSVVESSTVLLNSNCGSNLIQSKTGISIELPTLNSSENPGFDFVNWNTQANGSGISYDAGSIYTPVADTTLYAIWTPRDIKTVTFYSNDSSHLTRTQSQNKSATFDLNIFHNPGYFFAGWATSDNGTGDHYSDGDHFNFSEDLTLYAQWVPSFTFEAGGGIFPDGTEFQVGRPPVLNTDLLTLRPSNPYKSGYFFGGWKLEGNTEVIYSKLFDGSPVVFTANWIPSFEFQSNLGYFIDGTSHQIGDPIWLDGNTDLLKKAPISPFRPGYFFTGWAINGSHELIESKTSTTLIIFDAQWVPSFSFLSNGGVFEDGSLIQTGLPPSNEKELLTLPPRPKSPTREGYDFAGWAEHETSVAITSKKFSGEPIIFDALWNPVVRVTVPNLNGLTRTAAEHVLTNLGLIVASETQMSEGASAENNEKVVTNSQTLIAGSQVNIGTSISFNYFHFVESTPPNSPTPPTPANPQNPQPTKIEIPNAPEEPVVITPPFQPATPTEPKQKPVAPSRKIVVSKRENKTVIEIAPKPAAKVSVAPEGNNDIKVTGLVTGERIRVIISNKGGLNTVIVPKSNEEITGIINSNPKSKVKIEITPTLIQNIESGARIAIKGAKKNQRVRVIVK